MTYVIKLNGICQLVNEKTYFEATPEQQVGPLKECQALSYEYFMNNAENLYDLGKPNQVEELAEALESKIRRSKKVDVPTEQWQKDIERQLQKIRDTGNQNNEIFKGYFKSINERLLELEAKVEELEKRW